MRCSLESTQVEVLVPAAVVREMEAEAERHAPRETGGVLLGYSDRTNQRLMQITLQVGPGPEAVHESHRFDPDGEWQVRQVATAYAASGRVSTYLGDWHSHPHGSHRPSGLDRSTARRIALCKEARAPHPLILILHGGPGDWRLAVYRRRRWRLGRSKATITETS